MKTLSYFFLLCSGVISAQTTWYQVQSGTNKKLNAIDFPSAKVGYIGGNDSLLLKSTDGGKTWTKKTFNGVTFNLGGSHVLDLDFVNDSNGFMIVGPYGGVYRTSNGGSTWLQQTTSGNLCFQNSLYFFDIQNGFVGGSSCFQGENINKMTAGTFSIVTVNHPTWNAADQVVDIDFLDNSFGLAASKSGNILRTTDGGLNWDSIPAKPEGVPLTSVAIINDTLAYAGYDEAGNGYGLLRTTDGGQTWADDLGSATFFYPAYLCVHEANGKLYCGAKPFASPGGLVFENASFNWAFSAVDQPINDMASFSNTVVFGVGDSGYIIVNQAPSTVSIAEDQVKGQKLSVFPSPFTDMLFVTAPQQLNLKTATLVIYSVSRQIIHESRYSPGDPVDLSDLPPGVYLVELRSADFMGQSRVIKK